MFFDLVCCTILFIVDFTSKITQYILVGSPCHFEVKLAFGTARARAVMWLICFLFL